MTRKYLGEFTVSSGEMRVSDPCYEPDTWCAGHFKARNGTWKAYAIMSDEGEWGVRVAQLIVEHSDYSNKVPSVPLDIDVGVDSGQCGFYDEAYYSKVGGSGEYGDQNTFYGKVCSRSGYGGDNIIDGQGVVTGSGFGDGGYTCFVCEDGPVDGEAVAAMVVFIEDDEEEED